MIMLMIAGALFRQIHGCHRVPFELLTGPDRFLSRLRHYGWCFDLFSPGLFITRWPVSADGSFLP
jgi:hypothetical protein